MATGLGALGALGLAAVLLVACAPTANSPRAESPRAESSRSSCPPADSSPGFVNRVWKVSRSSGVEPGTYYVFLSDRTLLITSPHGTPALGRWRAAGDTLTLVEEGIPHAATVVSLGANGFVIRLAERGTPLDITFVPGATP